jgi:hypothetical protein
MFIQAMAEDLDSAKRLFVEKAHELVDADTFDGFLARSCVCGQLAIKLGIATVVERSFPLLQSVQHGHTYRESHLFCSDLAEAFLPRENADFRKMVWLIGDVFIGVINDAYERALERVEEIMTTE